MGKKRLQENASCFSPFDTSELNELRILQIVGQGNPHIVGFIGVTSERHLLLLELCDEDLNKFIEKHMTLKQSIPEWQVRTQLHQLVHGLTGLHQQGIAHRDLKDQNILLVHTRDRDGLISRSTLKIADFGFSTFETNSRCFIGTRDYAAPELHLNFEYDVKVADVWALAVIGFQLMYTCGAPFECTCEGTCFVCKGKATYCKNFALLSCSNFRRFWEKFDQGLVYYKASAPSAEFKRMLQGMFAIDPAQRTTLQALWNDAWFSQPCRDCPRCTPEPASACSEVPMLPQSERASSPSAVVQTNQLQSERDIEP
jgi:serine/threonine protein kinase